MPETYSRRSVLSGLGAAILGSVATGLAASQTDPYAGKPDTVTLTGYDEIPTEIERYRPRLVTRDLEETPTLYAWRATSAEEDTTMYCYWAWYATQNGLSALDSHLGDREPIYVEVTEAGDVANVWYDAWHYLRNAASVTVPLDGTRPLLYVQSPHHFYTSTTELGRDIALGDMTERYPSWHVNGWGVSRTALLNPWTMRRRGSWWPRDETLGFSADAYRANVSLELSQVVGGAAAQTDEVA